MPRQSRPFRQTVGPHLVRGPEEVLEGADVVAHDDVANGRVTLDRLRSLGVEHEGLPASMGQHKGVAALRTRSPHFHRQQLRGTENGLIMQMRWSRRRVARLEARLPGLSVRTSSWATALASHPKDHCAPERDGILCRTIVVGLKRVRGTHCRRARLGGSGRQAAVLLSVTRRRRPQSAAKVLTRDL